MNVHNEADFEEMVKGYIGCALWSSTNEDGTPLEDDYAAWDISKSTIDAMRKDCREFADANAPDLAGIDAHTAGMDFWLTRNRHGAGFWDRGLGDVGKRLTDAAHVYGECSLYVGDDNLIHGN